MQVHVETREIPVVGEKKKPGIPILSDARDRKARYVILNRSRSIRFQITVPLYPTNVTIISFQLIYPSERKGSRIVRNSRKKFVKRRNNTASIKHRTSFRARDEKRWKEMEDLIIIVSLNNERERERRKKRRGGGPRRRRSCFRSFPFRWLKGKDPEGIGGLEGQKYARATHVRDGKGEERTGRGQTDGWREAEEQSHRFKLKSGNTREGETFAGLSGLITPGTGSIWNYERCWCWWWWWWWLVAHSISASSSPPSSIFFLLALSDEKIILIVCPIDFSFSKIFRSKICIRGSNNVRSLSIFISLVLLNSRFDDNWKAGELAINSYGLIYAKRAITIHRDRGWYYSPARKLQSVFSGFESLFFFFLFSLLFFAPPPPFQYYPILSCISLAPIYIYPMQQSSSATSKQTKHGSRKGNRTLLRWINSIETASRNLGTTFISPIIRLPLKNRKRGGRRRGRRKRREEVFAETYDILRINVRYFSSNRYETQKREYSWMRSEDLHRRNVGRKSSSSSSFSWHGSLLRMDP